MHSISHHHATPAVHVKRYITRCTFFLTLEATRAFIIKKVRERPNRLPTQDVPPIPAAPNSTVEKPGASGRSMPPPLTPRSKREKTVLLPAAARGRFARAPLPAKGTTRVTFRGAATPEDTGSQLSWWGVSLDVVDVHLLAAGTALVAAFRVTVLVELETAVAVLAAAEVVRLVDLGGLGELAVGLERAGLVGCVLEAT
ncbi:hypothetical protein FJTKL_02053 [Diaporthe vaccinii]|uniref:Uncharacterized protein n=1 Tax=Diaporthe vaccinii TaxID=105482 RepID=A0ABR4DZ46_9PEZI